MSYDSRAAGAPRTNRQSEPLVEVLEWEAELSLFRSGMVLRQLAIALGIPVLLVAALLLILDWPPDASTWRAVGWVGAVVAGILVLLALVAIGLVYGGKYRFRYRLDDRGIEAAPTGSTATMNRIVNALLLLSGRPSAMGAGLLAHGRQRESVSWPQVDRAEPDPATHSIALHSGRRVVMLLVARPDNFEQVQRAVDSRLRRAASG